MHLHLASGTLSQLTPALLVAVAMAVACAVLSVFVVARRWAFIGEGISHSGFGGAGTAWLAALAFPAAFDRPWVPYAGVVVFSLATALAIAYLTRKRRVDTDTAIGIFLVASLAWGLLAQQIYFLHTHREPAGWATFFFGQMETVSWNFSVGAVVLCALVVSVVALFGKEIVAYCFDPALAEAGGVPARMVHYLLMLLVALTIVVGVRVAGNLLIPALLVLPGAAAMQLSERLRNVIAASVAVGLCGALTGLAVRSHWPAVPTGPAIVLALFVLFVAAFLAGKVRGRFSRYTSASEPS
jgi:ABC-type Mn2+/Zn2+ transport system permease subunit